MSQARPTAQELLAFRRRCRSFLDEVEIEPMAGPDPRGDRALTVARRFQSALAEAGLAGLTYPMAHGGQGLTMAHEQVWREEYGRGHDFAAPLKISHGMCLPMLNEFGTPEQKQRHLPGAIRAEEVWCQMFSEPGAGSDVAGLQMRAVADGAGWSLTGQKVWTTLAHVCERGLVLARTDPAVPKHAGISMFIVDMRSAGIDVRPIRQMDGRTGFNEIFFTGVAVPGDALLGELNGGWRLAMSMLMYERMAIGSGPAGGITRPLADELIAKADAAGVLREPALRQELMQLYIEETVKSATSLRARAALQVGRSPGPGGSIAKLHGARIARLGRTVAGRVLGARATAWPDGEGQSPIEHLVTSFQASIAGGTDEIQRNILGERVLGLPREPALDRDVPFSSLRTNAKDLR